MHYWCNAQAAWRQYPCLSLLAAGRWHHKMTTDGFSGLQKNVILNTWYRIELDEKVEAKRGFFFLGLWGMDEVLSFVAKLTLTRNNGAEVRHRCEMHSRLRMMVFALPPWWSCRRCRRRWWCQRKLGGFPWSEGRGEPSTADGRRRGGTVAEQVVVALFYLGLCL